MSNKEIGGRGKEKMGPVFKELYGSVKLEQDRLLDKAEKLKKEADDFNISINFERIRLPKETALLKMEGYIKEFGVEKDKDKLEDFNSRIDEQRDILNKVSNKETEKMLTAYGKLEKLNKERNDFLMKF